MIGLGVTHFVLQRFATGRAPPWPEAGPGGAVWAYASGVVVIAMGVAISARRYARVAALLAGAMIFLWALLRHGPILIAGSFLGGGRTTAGKALTFVGGALAAAVTSPPIAADDPSSLVRYVNVRGGFIVAARICLGIFFLIAGAQHFKFTPFVVSLIPTWFPGDPVFWARFAEVALLAAGVGSLIPRTAALAAFLSGAMVFSWFWIIHVPRALTSVSDRIAVFEALAVSGIALMIAGYLSSVREAKRSRSRSQSLPAL
ncbi:MAG: hypothetical protein ACT4P6_15155 [Gemmatimonadaceae bacterium]